MKRIHKIIPEQLNGEPFSSDQRPLGWPPRDAREIIFEGVQENKIYYISSFPYVVNENIYI